MSFLEMSFSAAVLILVIALLRRFFLNKLPKRLFLVLWGIALFRLLVPVSVPSSLSIYTLIRRWDNGQEDIASGNQMKTADWNAGYISGGTVQSRSGVPEAELYEGEDLQTDQAGASLGGGWQNSLTGTKPLTDMTERNTATGTLRVLLRSGWIFGVFVLAVYFLTSYIRYCREFRMSFPVRNGFAEKWLAEHRLLRPVSIRMSDAVNTPLTYGIFRPVILMPKETDWQEEGELYYVLEHEFVHIKRMDGLAKLIVSAAVCVHWFNPALWRMYLLYNRDLELSCDEAVIRRIGKDRRADYARTLIRMEERRALPAPLFSAFGRNAANQMEERITSIMKTGKNSFITIVLTTVLVGAAALVFTTSARAGTDVKPQAVPESGAASKPGEADWTGEFTDEETKQLLALWFEDYEDMTVSEFRKKSQAMTDTKEYMAVIERFSQMQEEVSAQAQADASLSEQGFADYFYHVYEPLNADKWRTREFGDYVLGDFSDEGNGKELKMPLEYFLSVTVLDPDEVTAGEYRDIRKGVHEELESFWQERTVQELLDEALMEDAIAGKIREITGRRGSENLKLSISYFYNPTDLYNAKSQEVYYGDKKDSRQWPMGTRQDYDTLLALMTREGMSYEEMTVADFNRSLLDWADEDYERAERIGEDAAFRDYQVSLGEEERRFVELTMRLSGAENAQLVRGIYKGTPQEDPWWGGRSLYKTAFDGAAFCTLYYQFPYHIPDGSRITVSERDERIERMEQGIFELFRSLKFEELLILEKKDMVNRLEDLAKQLSDDRLTIYIDEDQIGFEHISQAEYNILMNDREASGITVDAVILNYDGTDNAYLQEMIMNRTKKSVSRMERCMLAYEEDGSPLKIRWNFMDSSAPESYEYLTWEDGTILPGDTLSLPGGWSIYDSESTYGLEPPREEYRVAYVLIGIRQVEFEDGSTWQNPDYEGWLAEYKGKKVDQEILKGYYPLECKISW